MRKPSGTVLIGLVAVLISLAGHVRHVRGDVYVYARQVALRWNPASGCTDRYELFVSKNDQAYTREAGSIRPNGARPVCHTLEVADGSSYQVRVRAVCEPYGPGPLSDPSERFIVRLTASGEPPGQTDPPPGGDPGPDDGGGLPPDPGPPCTDPPCPVARAGRDFRAPLAGPVVLDGSASYEPEGGALLLTWRQVVGPEVLLEGATTPSPRYVPPSAGTYAFELVASNGAARSEPDRVTVQVVESFCPGDLYPPGSPDGILDAGDGLMRWFFLQGILVPSPEENVHLDLGPFTIVDGSAVPVSIRLQPDGRLDDADEQAFEGLQTGRYAVAAWELAVD
ncbi:MAG: hypothetical protein AB1640_24780 [bacterium]